ncbi:MAG TPA: prolyl oligopeptidase family serine peptidase [Candidatus Limnocylindrales bacterium]|nr:prolyl oligopeptidase family serine peptidase [Candidatus Limnocylindrales bacterium]
MRTHAKLVRLAIVFGFVCLSITAAPDSSLVPPPSDDSVWEPPAGDEARSPQRRGAGAPVRGVYKTRITPHWFHNNTRFWYRNDLREDRKEFIVIDAENGTRQPAFDHQQLAAALSAAAGETYQLERLPFSEITFVEGGQAIRFEAAGKTWGWHSATHQCTPLGTNSASEKAAVAPTNATEVATEKSQPREAGRRRSRTASAAEEPSPDAQWVAYTKNDNVYVRSREGREYQLTQDGKKENAYARLEWSPDSKDLVAWRIEPGERKEVYLIQSSPPGGGRAILKQRSYALPGDKFTKYEVSVFDLAVLRQIKPAVEPFEHEWEAPRLHWSRDQRHFAYEQVDRGHQRLRVIEIDVHTGATRNIIDEKTETFIWTAHTENLDLKYVNWLEKTDEMIYASERDGWRHLYLIDTAAGAVKNQITKGEYVVRGIDSIDEDHRQIWFHAGGKNIDQDPYFVHYYRVNFDGTGLVALTEANGTHQLQYSPDRNYFIDTYSRVDSAPVHELRRAADCGKVCQFEQADISELKANGWEPPEVFVAKGRDGQTDIWGIICRPRDLDPNKKYPVLEQIYAGPQGSFVPKSFSGARRFSSLTDLGFVVVQIDGMGTANRSKTFHDVCWHNLKDAGFPDRILWHKAVAARYPWYDITRVGIYGTSAGAQNAAGALLFHPEFYKAAVANSGCHDNRMDKASWNEQWMGYPVGPQYAECSNIENACRLQGHLMLVVGELDDNVPPESTYRFVDALIRANKDFDFLVVPNGGHGAGGAYAQRRLQDFFMRHLQGREPPNRNAEPGETQITNSITNGQNEH